MALAGGTAPCLSLHYDRDRHVILIMHCENRLIKCKTTGGDIKFTGACELDLDVAVKRLVETGNVWIRAVDRAALSEKIGITTVPAALVGLE